MGSVLTTTSAIASPVAGAPAPRGSAGPSVRADRQQEESTDVDFTAAAFESLLAVARSSVGAGHAGRAERSFASQIFEPAERATGGDRRTAIERAGTQSLNADGVDRLDRTSIDARRAAFAERTVTTAGSAADRQVVTVDRPSVDSTDVRRAEVRGAVLDRPAGDDTRRDTTSKLPANTDPRPAVEPLSNAKSATGAGVPEPTPRVSASAATGARPVGATSSSMGRSAAGQVARVLATPSTPGMTGSAVASPSSPRSTPDANAGKGTPTRSQPGRDGGASGGGRAGGTVAAEPSPFDELVRSIRLHQTANRSSARLTLDPPELGRIQIDIRLRNNRMTISVRTESSTAKKLMVERAGVLTKSLEAQGIYVDQLDVTDELVPDELYDAADQGRGDAAPTHDQQSALAPSPPRADAEWIAEAEHAAAPMIDGPTEVVSETRLDIRI